ncbi:MAG: DUF6519 domain-containing protein [Burkholderiaceae bacterium]
MKGDFTRNSFDPSSHYSRVLMQQGRVQLDADWNEQAALFTHYLRALARDLIGPHGAPAIGGGFELVTKPEDVRNADGSAVSDAEQLEKLTKALANGDSFVINPGAYYVDGIRVKNEKPLLYGEQAGFSADAFGELAPDNRLLYLDVWERHVTCVEDPRIREVALGGADTATRAQIIWQVKSAAVSNPDQPCDPGAVPPRPGSGRLRARAKQGAPSEPCAIAPSSTYRGAENQLYRIEILHGGSLAANDKPSFVWSRENGSVVFPIVQLGASSTVNGTSRLEVTLASLGRDDKLGLHPGDWVAVVDDDAVLQNRADPLLQVIKIDRDTSIVTLQGTTPVQNNGRHKLLRRWDHKHPSGAMAVSEAAGDADLADQNWIAIEDGIQIWFAPGATYQTGDYWLIPARVATGDVEWPPETNADGSAVVSNGNPVPAALPPVGPVHHYAPLGVFVAGVAVPGAPSSAASVSNCRCVLRPVTDCGTGLATRNAAGPVSPAVASVPAQETKSVRSSKPAG